MNFSAFTAAHGRLFFLGAVLLTLINIFFFSASRISGPSPETLQHIGQLIKGIPGENPKAQEEELQPGFADGKWHFQADIEGYALPQIDFDAVQEIPPLNYRGDGRPTFATYYASRNATMHDPYFKAAQQIVYRLLWDSRSRSLSYPVTVFVAPFVPEEQRKYFSAAGAVVRELPIIEWTPLVANVAGRLQDMFSKLAMWQQTEFSRIAYLDSDAFPLQNIDALFDMAESQVCNATRFTEDELQAHGVPSYCHDYVFAGRPEKDRPLITNGGVLVLKPDAALGSDLIEASHDLTKFDNGFAEQAFLNVFFRGDGPFPAQVLPDGYNNGDDQSIGGVNGTGIYILHDKIWALFFGTEQHWTETLWADTWDDMVRLYQEPGFPELRRRRHAEPRLQRMILLQAAQDALNAEYRTIWTVAILSFCGLALLGVMLVKSRILSQNKRGIVMLGR